MDTCIFKHSNMNFRKKRNIYVYIFRFHENKCPPDARWYSVQNNTIYLKRV